MYADLVGDYVRERYGMRCVLSTTRALADAAEVNRMTKRYDYVVLDYNRHKDPAFLAALEDRDKVEVMVNEFCAYRCPHRAQHYLHNSEDQRVGHDAPFECVAKRADFFDHEPGHPVIFTDREVARPARRVRHRVLQNRRPRRGLPNRARGLRVLPRAPE